MSEIRASRIGNEYDPEKEDPTVMIRDDKGVLHSVTNKDRVSHLFVREHLKGWEDVVALDAPSLQADMRQLREERDQLAAALAYARHDIQNCFIGCSNCGTEIDLKDLDFLIETDKVLDDPAECLKARDAEKDRRIAEQDYFLGLAGQHRQELEGRLSGMTDMYKEEFRYRQAAERKLATAREAMRVSYALLDSKSRNADRIEETLRQAEKEIQALAEIEQPQDVMGTVPNTKGRDWVRERFVGTGAKQGTPVERKELADIISQCLTSDMTEITGDFSPIADAIIAKGWRKKG